MRSGASAEATRATAGNGRFLLAAALVVPLLGVALLLLRPEFDLIWEHHPAHFWLVLGTAAVSVVLAYLTNEAASRHSDARLLLVSLAFLSASGFLGLHALATPGALLQQSNAGFQLATPVGLFLASVLAVASISPIAGPRGGALLRHRLWLRRGLLLLMLAWAAVSLLRLPPLNAPPPNEAIGPISLLAVVAVVCYAIAAWRYAEINRRRRSPVALAVVAALILLAEAMIVVAISRNWHLSWWEWHLLMTAAFALIAVGTRAEYQRTRSLAATFEPIYLESTLARIDRWHGRAIADLAAAEGRGERPDAVLAELRRDGASTDEIALLDEAARELRRLDELFRPYLPQQLATRLRQEPAAAQLGGEERIVSVLFADLASFTSFSESHAPTEVIAMLNEYWAVVVPVIEEAGGTIEHFAGDGLLVLFNSVVDQPDHVERAADCALAIQEVTRPIADRHPGWPRFRIGINTGPAVVGNVGTERRRSFASIGDTTNLGSRLMSTGQPGQVVIGGRTRAQLGDRGSWQVTSLGAVPVKGKRDPVEAWVLSARRSDGQAAV